MRLTFAATNPADAEEILTRQRSLIEAYEDFSRINKGKVWAWTRKKIEAEVTDYTTIYADGHKAGWYHLRDEGDYLELEDLFILPYFENRGIGSAVVERCINGTAKELRVYTFTGNLKALALFEKKNFRIVETLHKTRYVMIYKADDRGNDIWSD